MKNELIKQIALNNGFKLKEQPNGSLELNPYVYDFAGALLTDLQAQNYELRGRLASHERMAARGIYFTEEELDLFIERKVGLATKKDEQSLADIRAEAVMDAAVSLCIKGESVKPVNYTMLINHANKIKGAE